MERLEQFFDITVPRSDLEKAVEAINATLQPQSDDTKRLLELLKSDHIQNNKHRMGALAVSDLDAVVAAMSKTRPPQRVNSGEKGKET